MNVTESIGIDGIDRNWTVNRWQPPAMQDRGFAKGQMSKGSWVVIGYYPSLGHALQKALGEVVKDGVTSGAVETLEELLAAVNDARAACLAVGRAETPSPPES